MRQLLAVLSIVAITSCNPQRNYYSEENERPGPGQLQAYVKFSPTDIRHLKTRGYALPIATSSPVQAPQGFRSTSAPDNSISSTYQRRPTIEEENYPTQNSIQYQQRPQQRRPNTHYRQQLEEESKEAVLEEEKEEEEPDRLTLLLPNSKFECSGKVTGYYADEGLNCEVFHYCQDSAKHSWICPEGFTFHQVHLICMPPSSENICAKSSQFHFVNDYLYKPINEEEHLNKPNVSLRYSDRYYPESYYAHEGEEDDQQHYNTRKQPLQVGFQTPRPAQQQQQVTRSRPQQQQQQHYSPTLRPETQLYRQQQVFHSPEEVNISLQQRRPYILAQRAYQQHTGRSNEDEDDYKK